MDKKLPFNDIFVLLIHFLTKLQTPFNRAPGMSKILGFFSGWGTATNDTCMGRVVKGTTTSPWWWLRMETRPKRNRGEQGKSLLVRSMYDFRTILYILKKSILFLDSFWVLFVGLLCTSRATRWFWVECDYLPIYALFWSSLMLSFFFPCKWPMCMEKSLTCPSKGFMFS